MRTIFILICLGVVFFGCKKSAQSPNWRQGTLIGYDPRTCASIACGGLEITIKNDTANRPALNYKINATLPQLGISEDTKFPINVNLTYKPDTGIYAAYGYILVEQIKVIN
jgi:hypothetical protein